MVRKIALAVSSLSAVLLVLCIVLYDEVAAILPIVRGVSEPKTLFLSIRILLINIETLAAFLLLSKSIGRVHHQKELEVLGPLVLLLIGIKMILEFIGMFRTSFLHWVQYPILVGMLGFVFFAWLNHRIVFSREFWKPVKFTKLEVSFFVVLLIGYIASNMPLIRLFLHR